MNRMETQALAQLVTGTEAGGYTLPADLTDAYRTHERLRAMTVPEAAPVDVDAAAARVVAAVAAAEDPDLLAIGRDLHHTAQDVDAVTRGQEVLRQAVEQSANKAATLCADLADRIISEHLRPAFEDVLDQTRDVADNLAGYALDPHTLLKAPTKVRTAYLRLPELTARRDALLAARRAANSVGYRTPQHDQAGLFANFRKPLAFSPNWKAPAPLPMLPWPQDPTETMLWLVSPETAEAEPWFPTVAEQDAAWWALFGEGIETRKRMHNDALSIGGRIGA